MEDKEQKLHAVIYTDGSADNMKKIYGFGAHGYIYDANDEAGKTANRPQNYLVTNLGYLEPGEAKIKPHTIVNPLEYVDIYGADIKPGTNNVGEVRAVLETVTALMDMGVVDILMYTDSTYTQGVLKNSEKKSESDIKTTVNANVDLWLEAKTLHIEMKQQNTEFKLDKIKAHTGHLGNETADDLALLGRFESTRKTGTHVDVLVSSPKQYWKPKYERHTFLNTKQIFFSVDEKPRKDDSMEYYILNYKNENEVGKRSHTAAYGYVVLKERDEYVEKVKDIFKSQMGNHSVPSTVRMDNLFKPDIFKYVQRYGDMPISMTSAKNKNHLMVLENEVIANSVNPPALAYKAFDDMNFLRMVMHDYIGWKADDKHKTDKEFIEITDMFYTFNDKDKLIIKPELTNDIKHLDYNYKKDGKEAKIVIQLGTDVITRNQIKKLEKQEPRVYLVVINNRNIKLNYFTLIDLEDTGDLSVWTNYYSNTVMMK